MNGVRSVLWFAVLILVGIATFSPSQSAQAAHTRFRQDNETWIRETFNQTTLGFNNVPLWWSWTNPPDNVTRWWADADLSTFAGQAVGDWQAAFNQLTFQNVSTPSQASLEFRNGACTSPFIPGCIIIVNWASDFARRADYWWLGKIHLDLNPVNFTWSDTGKRHGLQHEIGHWIGIDEQYNESSPTICASTVSVMNLVSTTTGHCVPNVTAPTDWDVKRARLYWTGQNADGEIGNLLNMTLTNPSSGVARVTWKDGAYGESWHWRCLAFWNGSFWQCLVEPGGQAEGGKWVNDLLGFHSPYTSPITDRTMEATWAPSNIPNFYRVLGTVWYGMIQSFPPLVWSNCLQILQNPPPVPC